MFHLKNTVHRIFTVHEVLFLRTVQDHEFVKWVIFCSLYYKNKKIVQEKLSKQNSWKEKPKEKRNFPQDGSHFDIESVLNIISASGIKKKLMNTFYMLQEKF